MKLLAVDHSYDATSPVNTDRSPEVTNVGSDRAQLSRMVEKAKQALHVDRPEALADRGYYSGKEILACERAAIAVPLPRPMTSSDTEAGRCGKEDFLYCRSENAYCCPARETLSHRYTTVENRLKLSRYWTNACQACSLKGDCTTGKDRRVTRWEHEGVLETVQRRLAADPLAMRVRRETVEHLFGTLTARMGATHFLSWRLPRVSAEMALQVLAYNLTRVLNIIGSKGLLSAIAS